MDTSKIKWTASEQQALLVSMQHFGQCKCVPAHGGQLARTCDGHSFLNETDRRVDRPGHMLYVRRVRQDFIDGEWMGKTPPWDQPTQPVLPAAVERAFEPDPNEPPAPDTLPW